MNSTCIKVIPEEGLIRWILSARSLGGGGSGSGGSGGGGSGGTPDGARASPCPSTLITSVSWNPHEPLSLCCGMANGAVTLWKIELGGSAEGQGLGVGAGLASAQGQGLGAGLASAQGLGAGLASAQGQGLGVGAGSGSMRVVSNGVNRSGGDGGGGGASNTTTHSFINNDGGASADISGSSSGSSGGGTSDVGIIGRSMLIKRMVDTAGSFNQAEAAR